MQGDFLGFTFGGVHTKDLGITRVSEGDRYNETLQPEMRDIVAEASGMDGSYYFNSSFGPKSIPISIAFDSLTEEQFRKLRKVFGTKEIKQLIFDERPYKYYMAKLESPIELSYVCFDEPKKQIVGTEIGDERYGVRKDANTSTGRERIYPYERLDGTERIYKGEGTINFVCYFPFAKSVYKQLPADQEDSDWAISSGILDDETYEFIDKYDTSSHQFVIYNGGDLSNGFRLYLPAAAVSNNITLNFLEDGVNTSDSLVLKSMEMKGNDVGVLIDTNSQLITGVTSIEPLQTGSVITTSGNLYNEYIDSGYFFKIPPTDRPLNSELLISELPILEVVNGVTGIEIFYDYLYF